MPIPSEPLRRSDRGTFVAQLHRTLEAINRAIDQKERDARVFGGVTEAILREFQTQSTLPVTGLFGHAYARRQCALHGVRRREPGCPREGSRDARTDGKAHRRRSLERRLRQREIETKTVPELIGQLSDAAKARDAWLGSATTKSWLKAAGIAVGAASAVLAVVTAPVAPVALAVAGLGIVSGTAIPGAEWLLDWRDGKKTIQENGLHYLLRV